MKKTLSIINKLAMWAFLIFALAMVIFTVVSNLVVGKTDKDILGYKMFTVLSDSMQNTFKAGDMIICKAVDPSVLKEGDIITFKSTNPESYGKIITHKIRGRTVDENNQEAFITYGTTTDSDDKMPVAYGKIIGQYKLKLTGLGNFFEYLKTPPGYIVFILLPFIVLILSQIVKAFRLYKLFKKERISETAEEETALTAAQKQTDALMEEVRILKEQLIKSGAETGFNQTS